MLLCRGAMGGWPGTAGFQEALLPDLAEMRSSGTQSRFPTLPKGNGDPLSQGHGWKEQEAGEAEVAPRPRWPHSSGVPVSVLTPGGRRCPLTFPSAQGASPESGGSWEESSRAWGPPPATEA